MATAGLTAQQMESLGQSQTSGAKEAEAQQEMNTTTSLPEPLTEETQDW
jgi:hypothetical protein